MVSVRTFTVALIAAISVSGCTMTEMPMAHENPLDRIYDSGDFRLVLTGEPKSSSLTELTWANIYHTKDGELTDSSLKISGGAVVKQSSTTPIAADLSAIKQAAALSGAYTDVCTITASGGKYGGSCSVSGASAKGAFFIQFKYSYNNKSGIIYSNIVVIP